MTIRLSTISARLNSSSDNVIFPLSMRDISNTSLISPSKCLLDLVILPRQSSTLSWLSIFAPAIAVIPTIAFIGVRMSCDIFDKNSVFKLFALFAASQVSLKTFLDAISSFFSFVISCTMNITFSMLSFLSCERGITAIFLNTVSSFVLYSNLYISSLP